MSLPTIDMSAMHTLITGGTQGIGYGIARKFATAHAPLYLTYKWGSADKAQVIKECTECGAPAPHLIEADASNDEDTNALMAYLKHHTKSIDVFVSNVTFAPRITNLDEYKKRSLFKAIEYSSWPLISYLQAIKKHFNAYPKYVVVISSDGPSHFYYGYDFVAASKALVEHFARYLSIHLLHDDTRVNVIRFGTVRTHSFNAIFGNDFFEYANKQGLTDKFLLNTDDCGNTVLALCSGLLDKLNGQVITLDYGVPFMDNLMNNYLNSKQGGEK